MFDSALTSVPAFYAAMCSAAEALVMEGEDYNTGLELCLKSYERMISLYWFMDPVHSERNSEFLQFTARIDAACIMELILAAFAVLAPNTRGETSTGQCILLD